MINQAGASGRGKRFSARWAELVFVAYHDVASGKRDYDEFKAMVAAEGRDPNAVKVVRAGNGDALYFSRAPVPWPRDAFAADRSQLPPGGEWLRHIGIYAYRAGFLRRFPALPASPLEQLESLEQLRVLWHGERIAVHVSTLRPGPGVDTPEDLARVRALLAGG